MLDKVKHSGRRFLNVFLRPIILYCWNTVAGRLYETVGTVATQSLDPFRQSALRGEIDTLRQALKRPTPQNPGIHGFKVYSQTDEDGIIQYILGRLPKRTNTFLEIGCGNGVVNNTHYLALKGYKGYWVDGSDGNISFIAEALGGVSFDSLIVQKHFITTENIGAIVREACKFLKTSEPDFFGLDVDGNDLHVIRMALQEFRPLVICAEYNAKFPPPLSIAMQYRSVHVWAGDDHFGASLQAFCEELTEYRLVACSLSGANAFFVRRDVGQAFADYSPTELYQPHREHLIYLQSGHRPTLKWLREKLNGISLSETQRLSTEQGARQTSRPDGGNAPIHV